jgi:hypothetical protein
MTQIKKSPLIEQNAVVMARQKLRELREDDYAEKKLLER